MWTILYDRMNVLLPLAHRTTSEVPVLEVQVAISLHSKIG